MLYSEWLLPTVFPKMVSFSEKNGKIGKTAGQIVERIAGRYGNAILWSGWVGSQTTWRLSQGPGARPTAQPSCVFGWLQAAPIPVRNGISSDGRWPVSWLPFGDDLVFSKGVFLICLAGFCCVTVFDYFLLFLFGVGACQSAASLRDCS